MSKMMYAVYRTKRNGGRDNMPMGIFEKKEWAENYMNWKAPEWLKDQYWIGRVIVNKTSVEAYDITEHVGYKSK